MSYLLAVPFVTLVIIFVVVALYLLADFLNTRRRPNGAGKQD
jgi:hypothetical protein